MQVRAMKAEDIYGVTGLTEMQTGTTMNLSDGKYNKLLVNGATYSLASAYGSGSLWSVYSNGSVHGNGSEFRCPPCSFSKLWGQSVRQRYDRSMGDRIIAKHE